MDVLFSGLLASIITFIVSTQWAVHYERKKNDRAALRSLHRELIKISHYNDFEKLSPDEPSEAFKERLTFLRVRAREARKSVADGAWDVLGEEHIKLTAGAVLAANSVESSEYGAPESALVEIIREISDCLNPMLKQETQRQQKNIAARYVSLDIPK